MVNKDLEKFRSQVGTRAAKMTRRAALKYGEAATLPGGDPTRDVFDYCINELAGLPRYADMMAVRLNDSIAPDAALHQRAAWILKRVHDEGAHLACLVTSLRAELLERGVILGKAEDLDK